MSSSSLSAPTIRAAEPADCQAVAAIYNHYIAKTVVTFEEQEVSGDEVRRRLGDVRDASLPWLVAEVDGVVVGYAYASKWNGRCAYRRSAEVTVYLSPTHQGRGLGSRLYEALFRALRARGMHTALAGIALPNEASVALHVKFGMEKVAHFREVGFKFGRWIDVGYWQCTMEPPPSDDAK